jgi:hypothetical protein
MNLTYTWDFQNVVRLRALGQWTVASFLVIHVRVPFGFAFQDFIGKSVNDRNFNKGVKFATSLCSHMDLSLDSWINFAQLHVVHLWAPQLGHRVAQRMEYDLRFPWCPVRESFYTSDRPLVTSFGGLCWVKHLTFCSQTQRLSSPDIDLVKEAVCRREKTWVMLATGVKKVRRTSRVLHHWVYRAGTQNAQEISWQCGCIEHLSEVKLSGLIPFFLW